MHMWQPIKGHHCTSQNHNHIHAPHQHKQISFSLSIQLQIKSNKFTKSFKNIHETLTQIQHQFRPIPYQNFKFTIEFNSQNQTAAKFTIEFDHQHQTEHEFMQIQTTLRDSRESSSLSCRTCNSTRARHWKQRATSEITGRSEKRKKEKKRQRISQDPNQKRRERKETGFTCEDSKPRIKGTA